MWLWPMGFSDLERSLGIATDVLYAIRIANTMFQ